MSLNSLPNELLLSVADNLDRHSDINAFARSSRRLYGLLNKILYRLNNVHTGRRPALLWAAERGREATAQFALDGGWNVDIKKEDPERPTALHVACAKGHLSIVSLLISRGASINATTRKGLTPLHVACYYKHAPIVEFLLDNGANIAARDTQHQTPLHCAVRNSDFHNCMRRAGEYVKFSWVCGLYNHRATAWGDDSGTVELLLARNADPTVLDGSRQSPQSMAKNHPDPAVRLLIHKAANTARCKAELLDLKTIEKARLARGKAREAGRLAREQQMQAVRAREEAEARQRAREAREREEAQRAREQEEQEAREREAERVREQRLRGIRIGWAQMREAAERGGSREVPHAKAGASASIACAHSSAMWMKRKGKGLCELCLKSGVKHSFQCSDCGAVACGGCKTKFSLI